MDVEDRTRHDVVAGKHALEWSNILKDNKEMGAYIQRRMLRDLQKFYTEITASHLSVETATTIIRKHAVATGATAAIAHGIVMSLKEKEVREK